ncbi:MAG: polyprenol monophosphomannose synthase [Armatimonadetes bacterium]|nr:polyprenol monophosphomannose synthase [Armatimonadota bacterium]
MNAIVVIPTYNEADNIESLVRAVIGQPVGAHVLIVDDNSPDGTGAIANRLVQESDGRVHALHRPSKSGLGRAYLAGFAWALERGYEAMIEMDADFSHDPAYLPTLVEAADGADADVVVGSRYLNGISVREWPLRRILLSYFANYYVRAITRLIVNDTTSGFRLYRRRVLEAIDLGSIRSNGYSFQVEMTFRAQIAGFRIVEVPIIFVERRAGHSKMSKRVIWESVWMPLKLRARERALRHRIGRPCGPPAPNSGGVRG